MKQYSSSTISLSFRHNSECKHLASCLITLHMNVHLSAIHAYNMSNTYSTHIPGHCYYREEVHFFLPFLKKKSLSCCCLVSFCAHCCYLWRERERARASNPRQVEAIRIFGFHLCMCLWKRLKNMLATSLLPLTSHKHTVEFEVLHLICWHCNTFLMECASFKDGAALLLVCETCVLRSK